MLSLKRISPDLCVYLMDITGGTMTALAGEIAKISAFSGADDIKRSDIDAVTEPVLDAVVFEMTDMLNRREYGSALVKLRTLLQMQQEPLMISAALGSQLRRIYTARLAIDSGKDIPATISATSAKTIFFIIFAFKLINWYNSLIL